MGLEKPTSKQEKTAIEQEQKREKTSEVAEKQEISAEAVETADLLEKYFKQQFEAVNQRVDKIISIGKTNLEQGLKNLDAEASEEDPDYQEIQFFSKKLEECAQEAKQNMGHVMEEEPREERREPFGDFEMVVSAPEKIEPNKELKIHLEDKMGNTVLDFKELLPENTKIRQAKESDGGSHYEPWDDAVYFSLAKKGATYDIATILHEIGHAHQLSGRPLTEEVAHSFAVYSESATDVQGYKATMTMEKDAWMRCFQMLSAIRQTRGVDLIEPLQGKKWGEIKENLMEHMMLLEKKHFKKFGDQEIKNLFQETLSADESDLEKFDAQLELSEKTAQKNVRRVLFELYDKFDERKKQNPALKFYAGNLEVAQIEKGTPLTSALAGVQQMFEIARSFNEMPREEVENFINNLELNDAVIKEKSRQKMYQQKISEAVKKSQPVNKNL